MWQSFFFFFPANEDKIAFAAGNSLVALRRSTTVTQKRRLVADVVKEKPLYRTRMQPAFLELSSWRRLVILTENGMLTRDIPVLNKGEGTMFLRS